MMRLGSTGHAWRLGDLLDGLVEPEQACDRLISAVTADSRDLVPGSLFLACQGAALHALSFAEEAKRRGAAAIVAEISPTWSAAAMADLQARLGLPVIGAEALRARVSAIADRFYGAPSSRMELFGITGTHGKTSISHILAQALASELPCGIIGTIGHGFPGDLQPTRHTTSDAVTLQSILEDLRTRGARAVALEVSSRALDQSRTAAVRFTHAIFTNLGRDHLDDHGGSATDGAAVRCLFETPGLAWAVLNLDDPFTDQILTHLPPGVAVAGYSLRCDRVAPARCDLWVRARSLRSLPRGLRLVVESRCGTARDDAELTVGLLGTFHAANLLAVIAAMLSRGLPLPRAVRELTGVRGVPGRMECFGAEGAPLVVVDDAHTPDALEKALTNLRQHPCQRVISVLGCGGERDQGTRPLMGRIAECLSEMLILTDDNPRHEPGDAIIADILAGVSNREAVRVERQRGLAIRLAIALASTEDAVLVAGKGHETTQDLGDFAIHFSDRAEVVEALRERREGRH